MKETVPLICDRIRVSLSCPNVFFVIRPIDNNVLFERGLNHIILSFQFTDECLYVELVSNHPCRDDVHPANHDHRGEGSFELVYLESTLTMTLGNGKRCPEEPEGVYYRPEDLSFTRFYVLRIRRVGTSGSYPLKTT